MSGDVLLNIPSKNQFEQDVSVFTGYIFLYLLVDMSCLFALDKGKKNNGPNMFQYLYILKDFKVKVRQVDFV